jgi:hypothetical protein
MAFFINNRSSSEGDGGEEAPSQNHSARTMPLFKQNPEQTAGLGHGRMSLSAYISKHLEEASKQTLAPKKAPERPSFVPQLPSALMVQKTATSHTSGLSGQYLNTMDGDLTSGLEQYMPTPVFRLRVTKKRLDLEIATLRGKLDQYTRVPDKSAEMDERIQLLQHRLDILEAHEKQVRQELAAILAFGPFCFAMSSQFTGTGSWLSGCFKALRDWWAAAIYGDAYLAVERANDELRNLQAVFAERLADPQVSQAELGRILNRYDQLYEQARRDVEGVAHRFRNRGLPGGFVVSGPTSGKIK